MNCWGGGRSRICFLLLAGALLWPRVAEPNDTARDTALGAEAERVFAAGEDLHRKGTAESLRGAIERYEEALCLFQAARDAAGQAKAASGAGTVYYSLAELPAAFDYAMRSLTLSRGIGDRTGEAEALNNIGAVLDDLGEKQQGLAYYEGALTIFQALGNRESEAGVSNNVGLLYHTLGEGQRALEYHASALAIRESLGDRAGRGESLSNIGLIYDRWGEFQKALENYSQALALWRETDDRQGEATALANLAGVYLRLGDTQRALDTDREALAVARIAGDRRTEGQILATMGLAYESLAQTHKALEVFEDALKLRRALADRGGEATILDDIGLAYISLGETAKALDFFNQAVPLQRAVGDRGGEANSLSHIGRLHASSGALQKARDEYSQALALWRAVGDRRGEASTLYYIAGTERDAGNLLEARARIEEGLKIIDALRTGVPGRDLRSSYLASVQQHFELYRDVLMRLHAREPQKGWDALALGASERSRARSLLELLTESGADIRRGIDPVLLERERFLKRRVTDKLQRHIRVLNAKHTEDEAEAAAREVRALVTEREEVESRIRAASPLYAALTKPQPLSLAEIQREVVDPGTVLLEYALGEKRSFLWAVTPTSLTSYELPGRSAIEAEARLVYDLLTARNRRISGETAEKKRERIARADMEYPKVAARLSRILLAPVGRQLSNKRLLVVSDGALQYVPFGALSNPGGAAASVPLMASNEIASLPSASVLAVLRRELAGRRSAPKTLAVLADPVFDDDDERVRAARGGKGPGERKPSEEDRHPGLQRQLVRSAGDTGLGEGPVRLPRLPFTRREARAILTLVPSESRMEALDFEASRTTAASPELAEYRFVHFATHGFLNSLHPELSGLVLSLVDREGKAQDGFLPAAEVFNLRLPADLVVLSGCRTGLGKEIKGEGLVGLTQGFLYAGAARVLVSLWEVDDAATAALMERFYKPMLGKERLGATAALRVAQTSVRKEKRWRAPYYWATFVLQGEPR